MTSMQTIEHATRRTPAESQKVVVVNGDPEILELLESVLEAGRYDMVFVESSARAYSRIKHVQPDLVILCMRIDETDGFHLLSMLKLDEETRHIPLVTYTNELSGEEQDEADPEDDDDIEFPVARTPLTMN
jgi:CheY-like chemotaxis protein